MPARNTEIAHASDLAAWDAFVAEHAHIEDTERLIVEWCWSRARAGVCWRTIRRGLMTLARRRSLRISGELTDDVRRAVSRRGKQARPIRADQLRALLRSLGTTDREVMLRALCLVLWCGALRVSEAQSMRWSDLLWETEGVRYLLRVSKTDQYSEGVEIALPRHPIAALCPCAALEAWRARSTSELDQVWATHDKPISQLTHLVNRWLKQQLGAGYSSHSFRAGWITEAAAAGVTEAAMMLQTRHKTTGQLQPYIRSVRLWTDNPAAQVARRLG